MSDTRMLNFVFILVVLHFVLLFLLFGLAFRCFYNFRYYFRSLVFLFVISTGICYSYFVSPFGGEQGLEHRGDALHGGPVVRHPLRRGQASAFPLPGAHGVHGLRRGKALPRPGRPQDHGTGAHLLHFLGGEPMGKKREIFRVLKVWRGCGAVSYTHLTLPTKA